MFNEQDYIRKYNEDVNEIADKCVKALTPEDIEVLKKHPRSVEHHFDYGLYIRNQYIHGKIEAFCPDGMSSDIIKKILLKVVPNYDPELDDVVKV